MNSQIKLLIMGWFSYKNGHVTAGDVISRDLICEWLDAAGLNYDIALDAPFTGGVNWRTADPKNYSHVLFICGPFGNDELEQQFLNKFSPYCRIIGLNLSMKVPISQWNPFDFLIERNSSRIVNPDLVFAADTNVVPLIGICLVEEYDGAMVKEVNEIIAGFIETQPAAVVYIDTRLDHNSTGLRTPSEIETLIARVDVLITSRLHGLVFALKNGVPVIAIDPEAGGSKIRAQCKALKWPAVINADELSISGLQELMNYCLSSKARTEALESAACAVQRINRIREIFTSTLQDQKIIEDSFRNRINNSGLDVLPPINKPKKNLFGNIRSSLRKYFF